MLNAASGWLTVPCTILYNTLNMRLAASITGSHFWELIIRLSVTFGGAPSSNVDDSLDSAYLGPGQRNVESSKTVRVYSTIIEKKTREKVLTRNDRTFPVIPIGTKIGK